MESLASGTFVGAGSFRCQNCDYTLTLAGTDTLTDCPSCGGKEFVRASLFSSTERIEQDTGERDGVLFNPAMPGRDARLAEVRRGIGEPGEYLCYEEGGEQRTIPLTREWTRIGRSLAADVRFDDPTVSRRHALIVRQADGVRLLDDRSLNGVFVNGARVDGKALQDGDEIIVGRYRLTFVTVPDPSAAPPAADTDPASTGSLG
ncbi:MAG TPA: FHA domain-containing protein [Solirubrobacteraceae bacterium]|nr:FHA domain-containing protein [Solirubrobacteraceae bacterium]